MKSFHKTSLWQSQSPHENRAAGFSLLELMIVLALFMIVAGMSFMALQPALKDARANQPMKHVLMQLRVARQRAITERKQYIVCFGAGPHPRVRSRRWARPLRRASRCSAGMQAPPLRSHPDFGNTLPSDMQFQALGGVATMPAQQCPDGFGNATTAIDFDKGVAGAASRIR